MCRYNMSPGTYSKLHLLIAKNIVSMLWVLFVRKYYKLTKFIQKIDPNSRMPRIFMDSLDKSTFYI